MNESKPLREDIGRSAADAQAGSALPPITAARPVDDQIDVATGDWDQLFNAVTHKLRTAVSGTQLRSLTIVAARPNLAVDDTAQTSEADDNVVVVQAQFAPDLDSEATATPSTPRLISRQSSAAGRGSELRYRMSYQRYSTSAMQFP